MLSPKPLANRPIVRRDYCIDGVTSSPSLVLTLFENKSYPESWAMHYFLTAVTATFGLVRSLQGPPLPW
jgi:hypothetical protein